MIMVPTQNFYKHQENYNGYGGWGDSYNKGSFDLMNLIGGYDHHYCNQVYLGSDPVSIDQMAEEGSRTSSTVNEEEAGSSSKGVIQVQQENNKDDSWLQLGLGNYGGNGSSSEYNKLIPINEPMTRTGGLVELDLLPKPLAPMFDTSSNFRSPSRPIIDSSSTNNLFLQYPRTSLSFPQHHEITWGYSSNSRPNLWNPTATGSSSMPLGSSISRSFQYPSLDIAGPSSDHNMRVVDAPSRPHSGIWFVLQASQNQIKEPFLPQIPKSYLRIKDVRMTVRLLMKYLVNKLRLNSESEVEITCRGQQLQPFLTLQHVRDNIWRNSSASASRGHQIVTLLPDSSTTDHVMTLHYGHHTNNGGGGF